MTKHAEQRQPKPKWVFTNPHPPPRCWHGSRSPWRRTGACKSEHADQTHTLRAKTDTNGPFPCIIEGCKRFLTLFPHFFKGVQLFLWLFWGGSGGWWWWSGVGGEGKGEGGRGALLL